MRGQITKQKIIPVDHFITRHSEALMNQLGLPFNPTRNGQKE